MSLLKCKYSGCHNGENGDRKEYEACLDCYKIKPWKETGCCVEHAWEYANEVAIARHEKIPFPELIDRMIDDGVLDRYYNSNIITKLDINKGTENTTGIKSKKKTKKE